MTQKRVSCKKYSHNYENYNIKIFKLEYSNILRELSLTVVMFAITYSIVRRVPKYLKFSSLSLWTPPTFSHISSIL